MKSYDSEERLQWDAVCQGKERNDIEDTLEAKSVMVGNPNAVTSPKGQRSRMKEWEKKSDD